MTRSINRSLLACVTFLACLLGPGLGFAAATAELKMTTEADRIKLGYATLYYIEVKPLSPRMNLDQIVDPANIQVVDKRTGNRIDPSRVSPLGSFDGNNTYKRLRIWGAFSPVRDQSSKQETVYTVTIQYPNSTTVENLIVSVAATVNGEKPALSTRSILARFPWNPSSGRVPIRSGSNTTLVTSSTTSSALLGCARN